MLDHFIITVSEIDKSKEFYTKVLAPLNHEVKLDFGTSVSFGDITFTGGDPGGYFGLKRVNQVRFILLFRPNQKKKWMTFLKQPLN